MQTVIVTNNSGLTLYLMGKRIKPLREVKGEQKFDFPTCAKALKFEGEVNGHPNKALKALYSPSQDDLDKEGITLNVAAADDGSTAGGDEALKAQIAELAESLEKDNSKAELVELATSMKLEGFEDLNKGPLAVFIATAKLAEKKDAE